jgi:tRNA A37 N6-isopentenylltransferase MiaA
VGYSQSRLRRLILQFAKRQLTWFRRQPEPEWMELQPEESPDKIAQKICEAIQKQD